MLTLKEARKIQKERESKAVIRFVFSLALVGIAFYALLEFTNVFEINNVFYLIPAALIAIAVKKTRIYLFLTAKEFVGTVTYMNVYMVSSQRVKGGRGYVTNDRLEAEIIVQSEDRKSKSILLPAGPGDNLISEGMTLALLRFVETPIILEKK
ncbi:MAG: hypothetical protein IKM32_01695 [Clostridia bacterium]|nr:hypothetical protein [Clostridia bacterium]